MKHLNIEDIICFVSAKKTDDSFMELSRQVNEHIRECDKCLELVRSFQSIYDEFDRLGLTYDFEKYLIPGLDTENDQIIYKEKVDIKSHQRKLER